jgi:tetratricopeptide (TPR) repeat protein
MGRNSEGHLHCCAATGIGLQAISESKFSWKRSKLEWGCFQNRPFMRAYHNLGLKHLRRNEYDRAITIFGRLLSVNPNDNQGLRYLLPLCWFAVNEPSKVISHCQIYLDSSTTEMLYSYALALVVTGQEVAAREIMEKAVNQLPSVAKELLKKKHSQPRQTKHDYGTYLREEEAYAYWEEFGQYWSRSGTAIELLTEIYSELT